MSINSKSIEQNLEEAVNLRNNGSFLEADTILEKIVSLDNPSSSSYYELAFSKRLQGDHLGALNLLKIAQRQFPKEERISLFLVHMLYSCGLHEEAKYELLFFSSVCNLDQNHLETIKQFGKYISEWPRERALYLLESIHHNCGLLTVDDLTKVILDAVEEKTPFSFIRLGDGEGSCISFGIDDEKKFGRLLANARRELNHMWFGSDLKNTDEAKFANLSKNIISAALENDVVGIPYAGWINHEYKISSLRGVPCLVNILRAFDLLQGRVDRIPKVCTQLMHVELYQSGNLELIIRQAKKISIITCLSELPKRIMEIFELEEVCFYPVPGECGSAAILGEEIVYSNHFPERYEEITKELNKPHNGRLFLVAAGILGKFYASIIKRNGGIALDIGSVADGWANKHTRPGMSDNMALKSSKS